jgi:hypothetical protein
VFENRMLRRIFGLKRDEVMGERRKLLCNEELLNVFSSPIICIIRMIISRKVRWAVHEWRSGMHTGFWWEDRRKEIV